MAKCQIQNAISAKMRGLRLILSAWYVFSDNIKQISSYPDIHLWADFVVAVAVAAAAFRRRAALRLLSMAVD